MSIVTLRNEIQYKVKNQSIRMLIVSSHTVEESAWRKDASLECRAVGSSGSPTVQDYSK